MAMRRALAWSIRTTPRSGVFPKTARTGSRASPQPMEDTWTLRARERNVSLVGAGDAEGRGWVVQQQSHQGVAGRLWRLLRFGEEAGSRILAQVTGRVPAVAL